MLNKILGYLALIASGIAALFYTRSKQLKAEAEHERERADQLQTTTETRRRADRASAQLQQQHREEKQDAQESLATGRRDHLDSDW